jgi:phage-related holin
MKTIEKILYNTDESQHFFGFTSITDFIESFLRLKHWSFNATVALFGLFISFITGYVWDDAPAVYTLYALMLGDWVTGVCKSVKKKEFESYRLFRMPLYFAAVSFVLAISWWMDKGSPIFFFLPSLTLTGFYAVYFTSLLENCGELGLLPKALVSVLRKKVGLKALMEKISK